MAKSLCEQSKVETESGTSVIGVILGTRNCLRALRVYMSNLQFLSFFFLLVVLM